MAKLGAKPFFFKGGSEGVLLIHGYTGAPGEMRLLGEFLHSRGYTVLGVLLPGHCEPASVLAKKTFADWYDEVKRGFMRLKTICSKVYIAGLSMGGLLTLKAAAELAPDKIVVMAAPIYVFDKRQILLPLSMFKFIKKCKTGFLKNVTVPCLVMQSKIEHTVRWQSAQFIYDNIASQKKKLIWFEHCGHILTLDKERKAVFNEVLAFPIGLKMTFKMDEKECVSYFTPKEEHQSYNGMMHGGLISVLLDEIMGHYLFCMEGKPAYTAKMELRYRQPLKIGEEVKCVGTRVKQKGRLVEMHGEIITKKGVVAAEATAKMMLED